EGLGLRNRRYLEVDADDEVVPVAKARGAGAVVVPEDVGVGSLPAARGDLEVRADQADRSAARPAGHRPVDSEFAGVALELERDEAGAIDLGADRSADRVAFEQVRAVDGQVELVVVSRFLA